MAHSCSCRAVAAPRGEGSSTGGTAGVTAATPALCSPCAFPAVLLAGHRPAGPPGLPAHPCPHACTAASASCCLHANCALLCKCSCAAPLNVMKLTGCRSSPSVRAWLDPAPPWPWPLEAPGTPSVRRDLV